MNAKQTALDDSLARTASIRAKPERPRQRTYPTFNNLPLNSPQFPLNSARNPLIIRFSHP
ncbi:MAG: hypothetical protein Q8M09_05340 [Pseudomonadota bacterium]|nr:hypothetical protein [Pseudomonadota bacterium]MDP1903657.1 hypothetical protein [Pseudomonadota bacterium]MDP2352825.1 hypothetical protein [Pseudomonadota bacterium]